MIEWAITSSVLIFVVMVLRRLLTGKISLRLQYGLWALVLVRLLLPITFGETAWSVLNLVESVQPVEKRASVARTEEADRMTPELSIVEPNDALGPQMPVVEPDASFSSELPRVESGVSADPHSQERNMVEQGLAALWAAGAVALGLWLLWINIRFMQELRRSRRPLEAESCPLLVYVTGAIPCSPPPA